MREVPRYTVIHEDGWVIASDFTDAILDLLRAQDWDMPRTILDFKIGVARRCEVGGVHLLFWDELSFLHACSKAHLFEFLIDGVKQ